MKRTRVPQILLVALVAFTAVGAAAAADQRSAAAPMEFKGSYSLTFHIRLSAPLPPGTVLLCKARSGPNAPYIEGFSREIFPAQSAGALPPGYAPAGSTANCTVELPFTWLESNGLESSGTALSYEVVAVSGSGSRTAISEAGVGVAAPPAGGVASLSFDVSF